MKILVFSFCFVQQKTLEEEREQRGLKYIEHNLQVVFTKALVSHTTISSAVKALTQVKVRIVAM
jgi:hypothetical protein